jgi:hypothetical protein
MRGDVKRFTTCLGEALFRPSEGDKCCADATGRVDFASKRYRPAAARRI